MERNKKTEDIGDYLVRMNFILNMLINFK